MIDVEQVIDRVGAGGEIDGVVAVGEVEADAGNVVEQIQRVVARVEATGEVAAVDVLDVGDADRVGSIGERERIIARPRSTDRPLTSLRSPTKLSWPSAFRCWTLAISSVAPGTSRLSVLSPPPRSMWTVSGAYDCWVTVRTSSDAVPFRCAEVEQVGEGVGARRQV